MTGIWSYVNKAGNWRNKDVTFLKTYHYGSELRDEKQSSSDDPDGALSFELFIET